MDGIDLIYDAAEDLPELEEREPLVPIAPACGPGQGVLTLRDYQDEAVDAIYSAWQTNRSVLAELATGLGKTVIAAEVCLRWPRECGRILFLAHRQELIYQAADSISAHMAIRCGIEMGQQSEIRQGNLFEQAPVVVASVQTLSRLTRLQMHAPRDFGLIITDEAHHATANTYKTIYGWFQQNHQARFLGVTATPDRADEVKLGEIFDVSPVQRDICWGIDHGYLVDIKQKFVYVKGLDLSRVRTVAGDLNERDLEGVMAGARHDEMGLGKSWDELTEEEQEARRRHEEMLHAICAPAVREAAGRPGIVFCVTVAHARDVAVTLRANYECSAECVTQETTDADRREIIGRFKAGALQWLVGVGVFTEGFDAPNAEVIVNCRPTKSRALYTQMVGRGTRPLRGVIDGLLTREERRTAIAASSKPHCTVLDFVGASGKHKLICTLDVLGEGAPEDLREEVLQRIQALSESFDPREELRKLEEEKARLAELERQRQARAEEERRRKLAEAEERIRREREARGQTAVATYSTEEVDPFALEAHFQVPVELVGTRGSCSDKQVEYLVALGVPRVKAMAYSKPQAGAVIDSLMARKGGEFRITFGKHKGKSLALAGEGFAWWVENQMDAGPKKTELMNHIKLWRLERKN
jgi:superfamily II DNA or RNA helicase